MLSILIFNRKRARSAEKYREQDADVLDIRTDSFQLSSAESMQGKKQKLIGDKVDAFSGYPVDAGLLLHVRAT